MTGRVRGHVALERSRVLVRNLTVALVHGMVIVLHLHCGVVPHAARVSLRAAERHGRRRVSLERDREHCQPQQEHAESGHARILSARHGPLHASS